MAGTECVCVFCCCSKPVDAVETLIKKFKVRQKLLYSDDSGLLLATRVNEITPFFGNRHPVDLRRFRHNLKLIARLTLGTGQLLGIQMVNELQSCRTGREEELMTLNMQLNVSNTYVRHNLSVLSDPLNIGHQEASAYTCYNQYYR